jgi:CxxC-x17-CxxC domain-containing protein
MGFGNRGFRGNSRGGGFGGGFRRRSFDGPREMTKIKCSECGKEAEVPFKPRNDTPVYCKECYFKRKGITPRDNKPAEKFRKEESEDSGNTEEAEETETGEEEY